LIVTIATRPAIPGVLNAREIREFKSTITELVCCNLTVPFKIQLCQDASISSKYIIDVPDKICRVAIDSVVMGRATMIGTEFFIGTPCNAVAAFEAGFGGSERDHDGVLYTPMYITVIHHPQVHRKTVHDSDWFTIDFYAKPITNSPSSSHQWQNSQLLP
jgi:hypothetical protein